jgi:hypothetical protein
MAQATEIKPLLRVRSNAVTDGFASSVDKLRMWIFVSDARRESLPHPNIGV